jgi:protein PsiE
MNEQVTRYTGMGLAAIEYAGLLVVSVATVFAAGVEVKAMIGSGTVTLADLLLLFIYLEVLTMVGLYLQSGQLPVRMPLYIGMVALARYLLLDMKDMGEWRMLAVAGAVLLLAISVLVIRYGHVRFPYDPDLRKPPGVKAGA